MNDADILRMAFDHGVSWTRVTAWRELGWHDRRFRRAVADLRESGYPVISESGENSTYRKARSREEVERFIESELVSRSRKLEQQIRSLRDGADRYFGTAQLALAI